MSYAAVLHCGTGSSYLQVLFVIVVNNSQENRHEDVGVDEDVKNEEDGEPGAGIVCWHPAEEKQETSGISFPVSK